MNLQLWRLEGLEELCINNCKSIDTSRLFSWFLFHKLPQCGNYTHAIFTYKSVSTISNIIRHPTPTFLWFIEQLHISWNIRNSWVPILLFISQRSFFPLWVFSEKPIWLVTRIRVINFTRAEWTLHSESSSESDAPFRRRINIFTLIYSILTFPHTELESTRKLSEALALATSGSNIFPVAWKLSARFERNFAHQEIRRIRR